MPQIYLFTTPLFKLFGTHIVRYLVEFVLILEELYSSLTFNLHAQKFRFV